jgi:hypothetical protein
MKIGKLLQEIYGLFVDDPLLAVMGLVGLAVAAVLAHLGLRLFAGLVLVAVVVAGLAVSVRRG